MSQSNYRNLYSPTSNSDRKSNFLSKLTQKRYEYSSRLKKTISDADISNNYLDIKLNLLSYKFKAGNILLLIGLIVTVPFVLNAVSSNLNLFSHSFAAKEYQIQKIDKIDVSIVAPVAFQESELVSVSNHVSSEDVTNAMLIKENRETAERLAKEAAEREARIAQKVSELDAFLLRNNSPMAGYAKQIVTAGEDCGVDYRNVLAISMKESGLGVAMRESQKGTAFGYMDGISGESWETALPRLICKVGNQYTESYGLTLSLARAYGPKSWTNAEAATWLGHVTGYKNMIP